LTKKGAFILNINGLLVHCFVLINPCLFLLFILLLHLISVIIP
jgi:hypothetical protein